MVGVLVLTNFTYTYGSKVSAKQCGQWLTFNPSIQEELDELKFILSSPYLKRDLFYIDESIKQDFASKTGIFTEKIITSSEISTDSQVEISQPIEILEVQPEVIEEVEIIQPIEQLSEVNEVIEEITESVKPTLDLRKVELTAMSAAEVKQLAENTGIEYINKAKTIESILNQEYK